MNERVVYWKWKWDRRTINKKLTPWEKKFMEVEKPGKDCIVETFWSIGEDQTAHELEFNGEIKRFQSGSLKRSDYRQKYMFELTGGALTL